MTIIRHETSSDIAAIHAVNKQAFDGGQAESNLVDAVRKSESFIPELSLVAEKNEQIVGHILFSRIHIETENRHISALALAPMAVLPEYQKQGIGSMLVRYGLEECKRLGHMIVIVLGYPAYYPRFGFSAELATPLECPYGDCGDAWMVLELSAVHWKACAAKSSIHPLSTACNFRFANFIRQTRRTKWKQP